MRALALLLPLFVVLPAVAFQADLKHAETSDKMEMTEGNLSAALSSWSRLRASAAETKFSEGANEIQGLRFFASPENDPRWQAEIAPFRVRTSEKEQISLLGRLGFRSAAGLQFYDVSLERRLPSARLGVRSESASFLTEDELGLGGSLLLGERLRTSLQLRSSTWSDQNQKKMADLALMYGFSTGWPWIWVGYGWLQQSFSRQETGYWSPEKFSTHGLRFDFSFPFSESFSGLFALNLNNYDEDGFRGQGHYGVAGLQHNWSQETWLKATLTQIRSGQSSSRWSSDEVQISLQHRFE